jgi:hypothetical protein
MNALLARDVLPGPYAHATSERVQPTPAVLDLVRGQVRALLESSPAYHGLSAEGRREMAHNLVKIAAYSAALVHDDWVQSRKLGQTPVLKQETLIEPLAAAVAAHESNGLAAGGGNPPPARGGAGRRAGVLARAAADEGPDADEFDPRAANQVARVTRQTLNAIAFPTFVADLIKGTFNAMVDATIQQMEAYANLLANVAKTVDQYMADNITDNQARDYLASSYPGHFRVDTSGESPRIAMRERADDLPKPDFRRAFSLAGDIDVDEETAEEVLVPAARRQLAQHRHQVLATMVLMGLNRIVITSGKIRAQMGFRIDASDRAKASSATDFDMKHESTAGYGGINMEVKNSVTYVSSTRKESQDELNVQANLTGEVELKFKSDYMPLERFADSQAITLIQGNTPNPAANTPTAGKAGTAVDS